MYHHIYISSYLCIIYTHIIITPALGGWDAFEIVPWVLQKSVPAAALGVNQSQTIYEPQVDQATRRSTLRVYVYSSGG